LNPKTLKPPTALGIVTLLNYYGIKTKGKKIVIVGKGALVGWPLMKILLNFPYYATVTACDIFTKNLKKFTKEADIITAACGAASCIKQ
jgi:methylenetetrahydrofolate dehydrogenase (NADP+)/methenyltetrahydrofolate cyclohydrolase